ncbi:DUF1266 domain-containing protein [Paenibacillus sp. 481]|uniref:DUF1266 domain-containing protein n=1 Tax=Paenibacillus sp. 481 TaxID=2835869 RepID=UPI001E6283C4|nr:DUF1266 domain-containing protein [Paenibacillus sp. 481]UHA75066.1 DUF1266 domain-containing protein [Paenibacillus sp. 481]
MLSQYSKKQKKSLELYFRCLTSGCIHGWMRNYYVAYEFKLINKLWWKWPFLDAFKLWELKDDDDLKKQIAWLLDDGCREEYRSLHAHLFALSEQARNKYVEVGDEKSDHAKLDVVHKCLYQLPSGNITAFGCAWAIYLSRIGVAKKYITEEEAWENKIRAARLIQQSYSSWDDFYIAFLVGNQYFSAHEGIKNYVRITAMFDLMSGSSLLFNKVKWEQPLLPH